VFLAKGRVDVPDFRGDALRDPEVHRFAQMVDVVLDANPDQNALDPQRISVRLASGAEHVVDLAHVYGHPAVPLTAAENEEKFRRCCGYGRVALAAPRAGALVEAVRGLEAVEDVAGIVRLMAGGV
jgi:2-methylcitrate dehydratase PrpD